MKRILIGVLAILMLIATMPIATAVAHGDDDQTSINCQIGLAITVAGDVDDSNFPIVTVKNQVLQGTLTGCPLAGDIQITQNSVNFFSLTTERFVGRVDGTFVIYTDDGDVVTGEITRAWVFGPFGFIGPDLFIPTETVIGGWRITGGDDDLEGRGRFNITLDFAVVEGQPTLAGGGSFTGAIEEDNEEDDDEEDNEEDDDEEDDDEEDDD